MPGKTNQRHHPRVACQSPARAEGPRGPVRGICRSLSLAGMFFSGAASPLGHRIRLTVELPLVGEVEAEGEVRYHHAVDDVPGMGIRFTRLAQADLQRIQRFLDAPR